MAWLGETGLLVSARLLVIAGEVIMAVAGLLVRRVLHSGLRSLVPAAVHCNSEAGLFQAGSVH